MNSREKCFKCYRPQSSCMCTEVRAVKTKTKFIILMHPKEFKKIKNGSGHLSHLSLENSELFIGIDFSDHKAVNALIGDENNSCYLLYPDEHSLKLNNEKITKATQQTVIFILDSTWACSVKMLASSKNILNLPKVSFEHNRSSNFQIKEQPAKEFLSTIESIHCVLELLCENEDEFLTQKELEGFLNPFEKMIAYQLGRIDTHADLVRYKTPKSKRKYL